MTGKVHAEINEIRSHWAYETIDMWIDQGLVQGYPDSTYKLDESISRAEFVTLINRVFEFKNSKDINFPDVPEGEWFADEVGIASAIDYVSGYEDGTFKPYDNVSRQEAAMMLSRILYLEHGTSEEVIDELAYTGEISSWSNGAINSVLKTGLMFGYPDGTFKPNQNITRAETMVVLNRALNMSMDTVIYHVKGIYGPQIGTKILNTDVVINTDGVTLQNLVIAGDLLLDEDIEYLDVILKNITVKGKTIIKGGGKNRILFKNCNLNYITVKKDGVRVVASGDTSVNLVKLESGATLEESTITGNGFERVIVSQKSPEKTRIILSGDFDKVNVEGGNIYLEIMDGELRELTLDGKTEVTGQGNIGIAYINKNGCIIEQKPSIIRVANNIVAIVEGRIVGNAVFYDDSSSSWREPIKDEKVIIDVEKSIVKRTSEETVKAGYNNVTIEIGLKDKSGNPLTGEYEIRIDDWFEKTLCFDSHGKATASFSVTKTGIYNTGVEVKTESGVWDSINENFNFIITNAEAARLEIYQQPFINKKDLKPKLVVYDLYNNEVHDSTIRVTASIGEGNYKLGGETTIEVDLETSGGIIEFTDLVAITDEHVFDATIVFNADGVTCVESESFHILFLNPKIAGNTKLGETLAITDVYPPNTSVTFQWKRNDADITGATDLTYDLTDADIGRCISVEVKYKDTTMTSDSTDIITKGDGKEDNPYAVATIEQLDGYVRDNPSLHYEQIEDIDLVGYDWEPIDDFSGVFDGNDYIISNLTINQLDNNYVGLFSNLLSGGKLRNINLKSVSIAGKYYVGALVGQSLGDISNCNFEGIIVGYISVGGLIGYSEDGNIVNSSSAGNVIGSGTSYIGGLVGKLKRGRIERSFSTAVISATNSGNFAGGLVGHNDKGNIINCYATGDINAGFYNHVGGLVGINTIYSNITNSYAIGNVESASSGGGLVGSNLGTVTNSYYDYQMSGQIDYENGEPRNTNQMVRGTANSEIDEIKIYTNWDTNIWDFGDDTDYPGLK